MSEGALQYKGTGIAIIQAPHINEEKNSGGFVQLFKINPRTDDTTSN